MKVKERFITYGADSLNTEEIFELICSLSHTNTVAKKYAVVLQEKYEGSLVALLNADLLELSTHVPYKTACIIKLFRSINEKYLKEKIGSDNFITSCHDVYNHLIHYYKGKKNEEFKVLFLSSRNKILKEKTLFRGTVNEAKIYVRVVLQECIRYNATAIVIVHNHPGGNMKASQEDIDITHKLRGVLHHVDVKVLDHIIIGDNDYLSMTSERLI